MKIQNCKNCKYYDNGCQNFKLTREAKEKRENGFPCEYRQERELSAQAAVNDIYDQRFVKGHENTIRKYEETLGALQEAEKKLLSLIRANDEEMEAFNEYKKRQDKNNSAASYMYYFAGFHGGFLYASEVMKKE